MWSERAGARRGRRCGDDCTFQSSAAHLSCVVGAAAAAATAAAAAAVHRRHCALINQVSVTENRALAIDMSVSAAAAPTPGSLAPCVYSLCIYGARANPAAGCEK